MQDVINMKIEEQKERVFSNHPEVNLVSPCKIGDGILHLDLHDQVRLINLFENEKLSPCFFIPASGSGSRMFQFLFDFLDEPNEENRGQVERFLNHITEFAFFQELPIEIQDKLASHEIDLDEFVSFLLDFDGMQYGSLPKGLIPFHKNDPFILNPFQEHVLQGSKVKGTETRFHFTIPKNQEDSIEKGLLHLEGLTGKHYDVSYSNQNVETNSIAFDSNGEPFVLENGQVLDRPAGHGALLENLNEIKSDIIFIKNIDNVQHYAKANETIVVWKLLGGIIQEYKNEVDKLILNPNLDSFIALNKKYQLFNNETIESSNISDLLKLLDRPIRVCGMVRNEGQPGGGPFWVNDNGVISKQIVEKAQITMRGEQYRLMVQSTYFNPVMIAACTKKNDGSFYKLENYKDDSKFFVVKKKYKGQDIRFQELPGLWNGSMAYWNSIFVEIPSSTFSPVKTVLDLLNDSHQ
jgi:hypothetical protein